MVTHRFLSHSFPQFLPVSSSTHSPVFRLPDFSESLSLSCHSHLLFCFMVCSDSGYFVFSSLVSWRSSSAALSVWVLNKSVFFSTSGFLWICIWVHIPSHHYPQSVIALCNLYEILSNMGNKMLFFFFSKQHITKIRL